MSRIIHFEIHATDIDRVSKFYSNVFGWNIKKWDGPIEYWLVTTGPDNEPGINGAIMKRQTAPPKGNEALTGYINTIHIDSIDQYLEKVQKNGGSVILTKQAIPQIGWLAYCKDTEGNIFGLMSEDKEAK